ncbi:hypothetical protein ACO9S3_08345 [Bacillus velezensis]|uniref:hypothetical protein n=1 Tax=Bacillus velezensis TaxID=492670 RepID=UPI003C30CB80
MNEILKFTTQGNDLYLFKLDGKPATLAPELMAFEGYKDSRRAWHDIKEKEEFEEKYEYITLKGDDLKHFKDNILKNNDHAKVVGKTTTTLYDQYKSVPRLDIVLEEGIFGVMHYSNSGHANQFKKFMRREVNPQLSKEGQFDIQENEINNIVDEKEKQLTLKIKKYRDLLAVDKTDLAVISQLKQCETDLRIHKQDNRIKTIEEEVGALKQISILREGDMSASVISEEFGIYSTSNIPHNKFAEKLAKEMGIYRNPSGGQPYKDDWISIGLRSYGGKVAAEIRYSQKALELMKEYVYENGLRFGSPEYFVRGPKKGEFKELKIYFSDGKSINVNEVTYKKYINYVKSK